jgi:hypothetical protein
VPCNARIIGTHEHESHFVFDILHNNTTNIRPERHSTDIYYNTLLLSRVYEQKLAAGDLEAIKVLKSTSPVAWRNVNLIGNFDFTTSSTPVDIEALAARYQNEDFWHRSMQEDDEEGPER